MRYGLIVLWMLLCSLNPATAQVSINFSTPGVHIGINLPVYPRLERVPGYPVYYAPSVSSNYFFFDGLYWVYEEDNWYESSWYNGPWRVVDPMYVPVYLLRVPVRYYRRAPVYFRGWRPNDPPRWDEHWGRTWDQRRSGWNQWDRNSAPAPAPLPAYQRQYSGNRYPQPAQQAQLESRNYRYQPREPVSQQHFQHQRSQVQSPQPRQQQSPQVAPQQSDSRRAAPAPRDQRAPGSQTDRVDRQPQQAPGVREQQAPRQQTLDREPPGRERNRDQGRGNDNKGRNDKDKDDKDRKDRGHDR